MFIDLISIVVTIYGQRWKVFQTAVKIPRLDVDGVTMRLVPILHPILYRITQAQLIESLGQGLIGIFLPLLLLNEGLTLQKICFFYLAASVAKVFSNYISVLYINSKGAHKGLAVSYFFGFLFSLMLMLFVSGIFNYAIYLMPLLQASRNSFSHNSNHVHISTEMDLARKNRDLATMANLKRGAGLFTPLIGGFIAFFLGETVLTVLATVITFLAIIPALKITSDNQKHEENIELSIKYAPARDLIANAGFNIHSVVGGLVWPIYLALFIEDIRSIGIIVTFSSIFGIVVLHFVGKRGDKGKVFQVLKEGTAASSIIHFARFFVSSNPITITAIDSIYGLAYDYQQNPWTSLYYVHCRRIGIKYILSMEIAGDLAKVFLWSVLAISTIWSSSSLFFNVAFFSGSFFVWLCLLITKEPKV